MTTATLDSLAAKPESKRAPTATPRSPRTATPLRLDVVVPVHNEGNKLADGVRRVHDRLATEFSVPFRVTIADSASSDDTAAIARCLALELPEVRHLRLERPGRGRALRTAWGASKADVVACIDADLSTDLRHLPALLEPLLAGRADIVIGSRLAPGAQVTRGLRREIVSRGYNALLGIALGAGFSDGQCGFKAARAEVVRALLPLIEDDDQFFDTELLYLAQRNAFSIREIPVRWIDYPDSRVRIAGTAIADLRGIVRLHRHTATATPLGLAGTVPAAARPAREQGASSKRPARLRMAHRLARERGARLAEDQTTSQALW